MLRSRANWLQSIRRVTQINKGRRTPGTDREVVTTPAERLEIFHWLNTLTLNDWQPPPTKRVNIPKGKGKTRPLGIPTIKDRVIQAIVKNALEPQWEATFEPSSYGFRPGRSTHDAIEDCWRVLNPGRKQWILDADLKGAFDNIAHAPLLETLKYFPARPLIEKWLKAGVMIGLELTPTVQGTPQGGIISPLLANIALHGMEEALGIQRKPESWKACYPLRIIRYADDFVVITTTEAEARIAQAKLTHWLAKRGLELSAEKTSIKHISTGFDFLGFTIKQRKSVAARRGYAIHTFPSRKSIARFKEKTREILKRNRHQPPARVLSELNPLIRGWGLYYRGSVTKNLFGKLDHFIWRRTWEYTRYRHPHKGTNWRKRKYYTVVNGRDWYFYDEAEGTWLVLMAKIPIIRHLKVKGVASPDDPDLEQYWQIRHKRPQELKSERAKLWAIQKGKCPRCEDWLDNDEDLHVHHLRGREIEALAYKQLLHETCHHQVTINGTA